MTELTRRQRSSLRKRRAVSAYKLDKGCNACGLAEGDPANLHMDHLPGYEKFDNVSDMVSQDYSWARIFEEMEKCQVLCQPCHAEVTRARQLEGTESSPYVEEELPSLDADVPELISILQNALYILEDYHGRRTYALNS